MNITARERFEKYVYPEPNTGCWLWSGHADVSGYGTFSAWGIPTKAHRFSFILYKGEIPILDGYHGVCVCHSCDMPACVNPDHLFLGTQKENIHDRDKKGRKAITKGALNGNCKLNEKQVNEIRMLLIDGILQSEIAIKYKISKALVSRINRNEVWKDVAFI